MNQKPKKPISKKRFYLSFFGAAALMMIIGAIGTGISNSNQPEQLQLGEQEKANPADPGTSLTEIADNNGETEEKTTTSEAFSNDSKKKEQKETDASKTEDGSAKEQSSVKEKKTSRKEQKENPAVELEGGEIPEPSASPADDIQTISTDPLSSLSFSEETGLLWPATGDVILNYSMDRGIYFKTLGQYRCNPAILIGGDAGNEVCSAATGVVTSIDEDEETGLTLTMAIGNDYELVYGQLKDVQVAVGDRVEEGQMLAALEEPTKYYVSEGTHLYFKVLEKEEPVNPMLLLR